MFWDPAASAARTEVQFAVSEKVPENSDLLVLLHEYYLSEVPRCAKDTSSCAIACVQLAKMYVSL